MTGLDMPDPGWRLGGRYTLLGRLDTGIAGTVWCARDERGGAVCAVKVLRSELIQDEGALARLRATIAWIGQLDHPGIVAVEDLVADDGAVALVSRLVPGESLRALLDRQGPLPAAPAVELTAQLCDALAAARQVGVAHGGVRPSNLLLEPAARSSSATGSDPGITLRLTDFGMAALLNRHLAWRTPNSGPGSPDAYTAPELDEGEPPTEAADVYAVGVVLYEALSVHTPPEQTATEPERRKRPWSLPEDLPDSLAGLLEACLDENPRQRPATADLAEALRECSLAIGQAPVWPDLEVPLAIREAVAGQAPAVEIERQPDADEAHGGGGGRACPAGSVVAPGARSAQTAVAARWRGVHPAVVVGSAVCGIAVAAIVTFGFTAHSSPEPHASAASAQTGAVLLTAPPSSQGPGGPSLSTSPSPTDTARPSRTPGPSASPSPAAKASSTQAPSMRPTLSPSAQPPASGGGIPRSEIVGGQSGRCLDINGFTTANGTQAQLYDCNGGSNQLWTYTTAGQLTVYGTKCLGASGGATSPGTAAVIWDCTGAADQQWAINADGTITNVPSGLCLDAYGQGTGNGTAIIIWSCNGQGNQQWSLRG